MTSARWRANDQPAILVISDMLCVNCSRVDDHSKAWACGEVMCLTWRLMTVVDVDEDDCAISERFLVMIDGCCDSNNFFGYSSSISSSSLNNFYD